MYYSVLILKLKKRSIIQMKLTLVNFINRTFILPYDYSSYTNTPTQTYFCATWVHDICIHNRTTIMGTSMCEENCAVSSFIRFDSQTREIVAETNINWWISTVARRVKLLTDRSQWMHIYILYTCAYKTIH